MPDNPGAWLTTTARNRAIDRIRRERTLAAKLPLLAETPADDAMDTETFADERLELLFMCCHPALALDAQDRSLYDEAEISAGRAALDRALALRGRGPYVLQAAIASLHADEPRDWPEISALYRELHAVTRPPVVELNRAVAVAELDSPEAALALVDGLELAGYRYFHATRADLLRRLERHDEARAEYEHALALTPEGPERRFLEGRLLS